MNGTTRILGNTTVWEGLFLDIEHVAISEDYTGATETRVREMAVRKHHVVCVLPLTVDGRLVLIRQPRIYYDDQRRPVAKDTLETVAGKIGDVQPDESAETAARREVEEETGFIVDQLELLFVESVSAGCLSERRICFFAPNVRAGKPEDSAESARIEVLLIPLADIKRFLREETARGVEIDSGVRSMLFALLDRTEQIQEKKP